MGGYSDVVMNDSHLSTTCTAAASDDDVHFLEGGNGEGRLVTSNISLMGPWCETTYVCPWQLQQIHQGKPYPTTALTVVWLAPQT